MSTALVSCEGLVLRNLRHGETSRIATLFTPELGKIGVIAKGARDPKSPFGASLEFLSHGTYAVYYRPGRDLHFLRAGSLEHEFRGLLRDTTRFILASAFAEFLERVLHGEDPARELFAFARRGLAVLETAPQPALPELFRGLQLRVASLLGYSPRLEQCLRCDRVVAPAETEAAPAKAAWTFLPAEGGVLCPACAGREQAEAGVRLSPRALRRLRALALGRRGAPGSDSGGLAAATDRMASEAARGSRVAEVAVNGETQIADRLRIPDPAWVACLDGLVESFLRYHLDSYRGLRALEGPAGKGLGTSGVATGGLREGGLDQARRSPYPSPS